MRTILLIAAMMLVAMPASAEEKNGSLTPDQGCAMHGIWASLIMGFRQAGKPLSDMIQERPERRAMIMLAYEYPRYHTEEMQDRSREDFRIEVEKLCFAAQE